MKAATPACPVCESTAVLRNGHRPYQDGTQVQNYRCKDCGKQFNERWGTPMYRLRTPIETVSMAMKMRTEGLGIRASGRVLGKSHSNIIRWEQRMAAKNKDWSPPAPAKAEITLEGDEVYTRVGENLPPLGISRMDIDCAGAQKSLLV
jgi:transposase-like protein